MKNPRLSSIPFTAESTLFTLLGGVAAIALGVATAHFGWLLPLAGVVGLGLCIVAVRSPWNGLLLLTFFLPFERIGSVDIGGSTIRISQVIILCLFAGVFLGAARYGRHLRIPSYPILIPLTLYISVAAFALLYAPNFGRSFSVLLFILFTVSVSFFVNTILQNEQQLTRVMRVLMWSAFVVGVFGLYQFVGDWIGLPTSVTGLRELYTKDVLGFPRVQSTALEPLYYANYLLLPLSVLLSLFITRNTTVAPQWQIAGVLGIGVLNLLLTVARGGYIAFAASVIVIALYYFFQFELLNARLLAIAASLLLIGGVVATQLVSIDVVAEKALTHITGIFQGASYNERVETIELAQQAFREHPWVGIGVGSFGPYASWHPTVVPEHGWAIVNNLYLEVLAETGVLGFLALGGLVLFVILRSAYALKHAQSPTVRAVLIGVLAAFVGILVQYNTFSVLYIVHVWFVIGLLLALQHIALDRNPHYTELT
jgi:putative inorganic carbon (hco3(-)) transporter